MTIEQTVLEAISNGGRIGGHSRILFDANHSQVLSAKNKAIKVSTKLIDQLIQDGKITVENQQYVAA